MNRKTLLTVVLIVLALVVIFLLNVNVFKHPSFIVPADEDDDSQQPAQQQSAPARPMPGSRPGAPQPGARPGAPVPGRQPTLPAGAPPAGNAAAHAPTPAAPPASAGH